MSKTSMNNPSAISTTTLVWNAVKGRRSSRAPMVLRASVTVIIVMASFAGRGPGRAGAGGRYLKDLSVCLAMDMRCTSVGPS